MEHIFPSWDYRISTKRVQGSFEGGNSDTSQSSSHFGSSHRLYRDILTIAKYSYSVSSTKLSSPMVKIQEVSGTRYI